MVLLEAEAVTALTVVDVNSDGLLDVVAGTQTAANGGRLIWLRNNTGAFDFDIARDGERPGHRHRAGRGGHRRRRGERPGGRLPRRARRATSAA